MTKLSIPEVATQLISKTLTPDNGNTSRTIFVVGNKSVGKSTLLYSFLDKADVPRETVVIEYSFGRKSNQKQGIEKTLCHLWEYGGKLESLNSVLTSIPKDGKWHYCIMIDLSKIKSMWDTLETCFKSLKDFNVSSEKLPEVIIIGGKYDIFKNYDSEMKKFICTSIRTFALINRAHILFYSSKDPQLSRKTKDVLHNIGFGNSFPTKDRNTNFTKPLFIQRGSDSWDSIGVAASTIEQVKARHLQQIPSSTLAETTELTSSQQHLHPESVLDGLINQKYSDLRNMESLDISIDYLPTF